MYYIKNCEGSWVENGFYPWSTWSAWSYCSVGMTNKTNDMEVLCEGLGDSYAGGVNGHSTIYAKKCWFSYPEDSNKKAIEGELVSGQAEQTCDQYGIRKISKEFVKNQSCRCRYK